MNTPVTPPERPAGSACPGRAAAAWQAVPGLSAAVVVAIAATGLGRLLPIVGGPVIGIALGLVTGSALGHGTDRRRRLDRGAAIAAGPVLQLSVVLLGTGLSLSQVVRTGTSSLPVMLGTLAVALLGARVVGRVLRLTGDTTTLIGVGTGICGASAIAAVTAVIGAAEADVAYAIATIFTFNIAAVLLYPVLGHLLGLSQHSFGLWAGTAVNDTSSVVAAARSYGSAAASYAVVVKLTRSLMIIPICVALGVRTAGRSGAVLPAAAPTGPPAAPTGPPAAPTGPPVVPTGPPAVRGRLPWRRMFPLFLLGFLAASAVNTAGAVPDSWHSGLLTASAFLITVALAGIGLATRPASLRAAGIRPLILGATLWAAVGVTSLLLQLATGNL